MSEPVTAPRTVVIDLARIGAEWTATSAQLAGFRVVRDDRAGVEAAARKELTLWLGPAARVEFRELGP